MNEVLYYFGCMLETKKRKKRRKRRYNWPRLLILLGLVLVLGFSVSLGTMKMVQSIFNKTPANTLSTTSLASSSKSSSELSFSSAREISDVKESDETLAQSSSIAIPQESSDPKVEQLVNLKNVIETNHQENSLSDLKQQITAYLTEHNYDPNKVSWAVQDLITQEIVESSNAKQNFTAASTYKLPLCVYYYEEIARGNINPSDALEYTEEMREEEDDENLNQPIHRKYKVGDKIQIDELLEAALLYSDNIAGHMLYEHIGGYDKFKEIVARYTDQPQTQDFFSEQSNVINADYMMRLLNYVYNTPNIFNDLKFWLQYTAYDTFLNRDIPGTYIQKIGNIDEVRNAVGISNGLAPFTLSIYSCISKTDGMNLLADIGKICLEYFENRYNSNYYIGQDLTHYINLNGQMSNPPDVIEDRAGLDGQTLPELTEEEKKKMEDQNNQELGNSTSSETSSST